MHRLSGFNPIQIKAVSQASERASTLVTNYYRVAPREWDRMRYEVRTLNSLRSSEIVDHALAQTLCYGFSRRIGRVILEERDLYRICLQDHRILDVSQNADARLDALLTYVLTHELVHVVRFGQRLQRIDLPDELRPLEEMHVEKTTRKILSSLCDPEVDRLLRAVFT